MGSVRESEVCRMSICTLAITGALTSNGVAVGMVISVDPRLGVTMVTVFIDVFNAMVF